MWGRHHGHGGEWERRKKETEEKPRTRDHKNKPRKQTKKTAPQNSQKDRAKKQAKKQAKKTGQMFSCVKVFSGGGFSQIEDEYQACLGNVISFTTGIRRLSACFEKVTKNEETTREYKNSCVCRTKKRRNMSKEGRRRKL